MTTLPASSSLKLLPTGRCNYNFPNLDKNTTCGCQRFLLGKKKKKKKPHKAPSRPAEKKSGGQAAIDAAAAQDGSEAEKTVRGDTHHRVHDDAHGAHNLKDDDHDDGDNNDGDSEDDDGGDVCRCGHYSCYHSGHPPPPEPCPSTVRPQDRLELQRDSYACSSAAIDDAAAAAAAAASVGSTAIVRTDRSSANAAALSGISGTTTERDSSASGTPRVMIKPPWTTKTAAKDPHHHHHPHPHPHPHSHSHPHHQSGRSDNTKHMSGQLQTALGVERLQMSPVVLERPLSVSSNASMSDRAYKEKFRKLVEYTNALSSNQMSQRERLEMMEVVPQALEELADKVELMDDHVNDKVDSCEIRLKNELDDRLAPIESFLKAHQARGEKRKRRHQPPRPAAQAAQAASALLGSEAPEASSSIRHDRKRRRRHDERDASEIFNSQPPHGITTTSFTTTSFTTTTTSSFSSPAATSRHLPPDHVSGLKVFSELEMLKSRLADIESVAPPTVARPWVVEVVLVPPALPGIWAEAGASAPNTQYTGSEPASGSAQAAQAAGPTPLYRSQPSSQQQPARAVPFSFSPKSKVYKRLHSRGFIKRLHITGPSAREVSFTIETNFADLFEWLASLSVSRASSRCLSQRGSRGGSSPPLPKPPPSISSSQRTARGGTRNLWQPLRKIYKQAALESLPSCELSAPALWTVDFLKANCMMRGTTRKPLYIVPRTSASVSSALTWDDIRQLDRSYEPDSEPDVGESDDEEETFWKFDPKLDARPLHPSSGGGGGGGGDNNNDGGGGNSGGNNGGGGGGSSGGNNNGGGGGGGGNNGGGGGGGGGSFFSDPFGSFGPFPAEGDSFDATPAKLPSFSSHLASPQRQEATPPDTVPQLQPRQSSKLNRARTPVGRPVELKVQDDDPKHPAPIHPPKKPLPKSGHSAAATPATVAPVSAAAAQPSPPSPPQSYPTAATATATQSRRRKLVSREQPHQAPREHAASPADHVPRPSGTQQWPSRSFEALETFGVGSWQDTGSSSRQQWSGPPESAAEAESPDWGSLFGTPPADSALVAGAAEEQVEGPVEGPAESQAEGQAEGMPAEDQVEGDEDAASAAVLPPLLLPVGDSIVDYNGDGGYHSD